MNALLQIRPVFFGLFLLTVVSMAFALFYLERTLGLPPCPLCITQRLFVVLVGVFALLAAIQNPQGWGRRVYATLCLISAAAGGAVAMRHIWLQNLPEELAPACGPSLEYMLETLPFSETFSVVMMGDGNCAETVWTFMGLSIPEQTLALFVVLAGVSVFQLVRKH
ncbi:disulfide bond formation protein B [Congregibacter brevis]|uniref:Disulfide bond formation protein B n=1 Tax=Congregibacter brevis TaxID=3081201 RepID=A0ABZ0IEA2_9GAMM|nr:disulfide bond formation protein B [Congregibacter sp. IMCC45268]